MNVSLVSASFIDILSNSKGKGRSSGKDTPSTSTFLGYLPMNLAPSLFSLTRRHLPTTNCSIPLGCVFSRTWITRVGGSWTITYGNCLARTTRLQPSAKAKVDARDRTPVPSLTKSSVRPLSRIGLVGQLQVVRIYLLEIYVPPTHLEVLRFLVKKAAGAFTRSVTMAIFNITS
jgi:hypothetical protein